MHDPLTFEARLADAFERYLAVAPVELDAVEVAAVAAGVHRPSVLERLAARLGVPRSPMPRAVRIALVVGLLAALAASAAWLVGQMLNRPPSPWVYRDVVVTAGTLSVSRGFPAVVTLADGRVLILGEAPGGTSAEVFDPRTGITTMASSMLEPASLVIGDAALLGDGRVLVVGDARPLDEPFHGVLQVFDPATLTFAAIEPMQVERAGASLAVLADGGVLVTGGSPPTDSNTTIASAEVFDPTTNVFSLTGSLAVGRQGHSSTTLDDGTVLVYGGEPTYTDGSQRPLQAERYDPRTGTFEVVPELPSVTGTHVAVVLPDGRILFFDRNDLAGNRRVVAWDPRSGQVETLPLPAASVWDATSLDDGRVLLVGGQSSPGYLGTLDPETATTATLDPMAGFAPAAVRLADGRILLVGGLEDAEVHHPELGGQLAPPISSLLYFE